MTSIKEITDVKEKKLFIEDLKNRSENILRWYVGRFGDFRRMTKQDRKRLSKQKHEIAYVRKLARDSRKAHENAMPFGYVKIKTSTHLRLCKAVLKFARYKKL